MKDRKVKAEEHIAQFGETSVVRVDGRIQIRGGPMSDRVEAMEWLNTFMPEEEVEEVPPPKAHTPQNP